MMWMALVSFAVALLCFGFILAADPVYSPQTLLDAAGNSADNAAAITWASLPSGSPLAASSPERVEPQLTSYHSIVNGFIDVVSANGFPKVALEKAATNDLNIGDVANSYKEYQSSFMGFGICVAIGLLFVPIFMIVICCMCCCRCCCDNCGGKREQPEKEANNMCRKYAFVIVMTVVIAMLVTASSIIWALNGSVSDAIDTIPTTVDNNLQDLQTYANNTVDKINHIATTNFQFMMDTINRDLENDSIAYLVGIPLRTDIESNTNIRTTLSDAATLATDLDAADAALTDVETNNTELQTSIATLDSALSAFKTNMSNILSSCGGACPAPKPNVNNINTDVDSSQFPDLTSVRTSMDNAIAANLTAKLLEAEQELDAIPDTVAEKSFSTRNSLKDTTSDLSDELDTVTNNIQDLQNKISGDDSSLDNYSNDVEDLVDGIKPYDKYRSYAYLALAGLVLTITLFALLGLACGVLGTCSSTSPVERGCVPHCGGCLLVLFAVVSSILLLFILLFLTIPLFAIGAPAQAFICKPLTDLTYMEELWNVYNDAKVGAGNSYMGDFIHGNKTIHLSPTGILKDCESGKSFWSTFRFDERFDLDDLLNYSKTLDVQSEIDSVNVDLSSVEVYPTDLQSQLTDALDAIDVNFTAFYAELSGNLTNTNLSAKADEIDKYVTDNGITGTIETQLNDAANDLRTIETTEYADVELKIAALNTSVANMEAAVAPIPTKISNLQTGLQTAHDFIQNSGSDIVKPHLTTYANRLISIVDSYKNFTIDAVVNQLGDCKLVWNLYNSMVVYTFCYNFIDLFNGSWFAFGWCVFFFFIGFIFSLKLSKYFLRMTKDSKVGPDPSEKPSTYHPDEENAIPQISNRKFNHAQFSRKHRTVAPSDVGKRSFKGDW